MNSYWLSRIAQLPILLFGVTFVTFMFVHLMPGGPGYAMLGELATPEAVAKIDAALGLDKPAHVQYVSYLGKLAHGDLGNSLISGSSVATELLSRFPATMELAVAALLIAFVVGLPLGIAAATARGSFIDTFCTLIALIGLSVPTFFLGLMLIYSAAAVFQILPPGGRLDYGITLDTITGFVTIDSILQGNWEAFKSAIRHLILPSIALSSVPMAVIARITRSAMLEALGQDYMRTGRAKGATEFKLVVRHALKNALLPIITVVGLQVGRLLTGSILTETIFNWPGMGNYVYTAVGARDLPVIQNGILFFAVVFIVVNFLVDVTYALVDPRIRYS